MSEPTADSVFTVDGDRFVPSLLGQTPWAEGVLHGGPAAGLLAHLCEQAPNSGPEPKRPVRLTVELLRAIPLQPLEGSVEIIRPGRKVDWLVATLRCAGQEVARATALRLREAATDLPSDLDAVPADAEPGTGLAGRPEDGRPTPPREDVLPGFHNLCADIRFVRSSNDEPGPGQAWVGLRYPLVEGRPTTGWMRAAACADFGGAVSALLDIATHSYINADLTVSLWRPPRGQWIGLDARTRVDTEAGIGVAQAQLWDLDGPIGRSQQCLVVERRS